MSIQNLQELRDQRSALNEQIKQAFLDAVKVFFEAYPDTHIIWAQYAPYFNDGDPCYFSVHTPEVRFEDSLLEDASWGYGDNCEMERLDAKGQEMAEGLLEFIRYEQDLMETLYGSDALVDLSRDGDSVGVYEHD